MADSLDEYKGANKWEGLFPAVRGPREWDEGFRSFLVKYGTLNHVVYDVFVNREKDKTGVRGACRFDTDLEAFSREGLWFRYLNSEGEEKSEYDFTEEYDIISNLMCSPRSFFSAEDNWFGFIALSKDASEMVIVFRGTQTQKEWVEDASLFMEQLDGEEPEHGCALFWNRKDLMVHTGFHQLYIQEGISGAEAPKATIRRMVKEHKDTLSSIVVVGHSLGGALCQLCAFDLVHFGISGDIPVVAIAWGSPKVGNAVMAKRAKELHPKLRILRVSNVNDYVPKVPPEWLWTVTTGGYHHMGHELRLDNSHLVKDGLVRTDESGANHNLEMYLQMIDPSRDPALMNKVGTVLSDSYMKKNKVNPYWHNQSWPRTIF